MLQMKVWMFRPSPINYKVLLLKLHLYSLRSNICMGLQSVDCALPSAPPLPSSVLCYTPTCSKTILVRKKLSVAHKLFGANI